MARAQNCPCALALAPRCSPVQIPSPPMSIRLRGKKTISQNDYSPIHVMVTLLNRTLQSTLGYDTVIRRT